MQLVPAARLEAAFCRTEVDPLVATNCCKPPSVHSLQTAQIVIGTEKITLFIVRKSI